MKLSRRQFVVFGGVGTAGAAVAGVGSGLAIMMTTLEDGIVESIRQSFPGLNMNDGELREFAGQMASYLQLSHTKSQLIASLLDYPVFGWAASLATRERVRRLRGLITSHFLLATDYLDPARGDGPVTLLIPVDPYVAVCSNKMVEFEAQTLDWPE